MEDLEAALEQFREIAGDLGSIQHVKKVTKLDISLLYGIPGDPLDKLREKMNVYIQVGYQSGG